MPGLRSSKTDKVERIKWLDEVRIADADDVGDDAASLGELHAGGLPVADGFVVMAEALRQVVDDAGVDPALAFVEHHTADGRIELARLRQQVRCSALDSCTGAQLVAAYRHLAARLGLLDPSVEIRASLIGPRSRCLERRTGDRGRLESHDRRGAGAVVIALRCAVPRRQGSRTHPRRAACRCDRAAGGAGAPLGDRLLGRPHAPLRRCRVRRRGVRRGSGRLDRSAVGLVSSSIARRTRWSRPDWWRRTAEVVVRDGSATEVALPPERRHTRALTDEQASEVGRTAVLVERCLGGPQIVDWGLRPDGELVVRGARPLAMASGY